jgi:putative (di)nucleoside polyphosphate hydrolase
VNGNIVQALYVDCQTTQGLKILLPKHVDLVAKTPKWLRYDLPKQHIRHRQKPLCIGQKQIWFFCQTTQGLKI